ncbi:MAG: hypothetical protein AAF806_32195 [Bacteroidota bacterium]
MTRNYILILIISPVLFDSCSQGKGTNTEYGDSTKNQSLKSSSSPNQEAELNEVALKSELNITPQLVLDEACLDERGIKSVKYDCIEKCVIEEKSMSLIDDQIKIEFIFYNYIADSILVDEWDGVLYVNCKNGEGAKVYFEGSEYYNRLDGDDSNSNTAFQKYADALCPCLI